MAKQTNTLALMAAAVFAVAALTSGGRLQAARDLPAPHINVARLIPAVAQVKAAGLEGAGEMLPTEPEITTSETSSDEGTLVNQEKASPTRSSARSQSPRPGAGPGRRHQPSIGR